MSNKEKKTQKKLAGKIGVCPEHLSEVKRGVADLSGGKAKVMAKKTSSPVEIWLAGATKQEIKARAAAIDKWCKPAEA